MADCMSFPKTMNEFLEGYSFKDTDEVYTNGSELIQVFRVKQGFEHYEKEIREQAITEFAEKMNARITEFILEHHKRLDFVSGVGMGWKFVDEIATELKGE